MAITITAVPDLAATPPSAVVTVASTTAATVTLVRQHPDGTRVDVRTPDGGPLVFTAAGQRVLVDSEAPYGQPLLYSAGGVYSPPVTVTPDRPWLVNVGTPARSVAVIVQNAGTRSTTVRQGLFDILGRARPLPVGGGPRTSPRGNLLLRSMTLTDADALEALLADGAVLLLNVPADRGWRLGTEYLAVGDVAEDRIVPYGPAPYRTWNMAYAVVDAPVGGTQDLDTSPGGGGNPAPPGSRTMADLAVELAALLGRQGTMADAAGIYSDMADAAAGGG